MSIQTRPIRPDRDEFTLPADFADRLERSLRSADHERRRRTWYRRARALLPIILLVGPIIGWRLMLASPDGVHVGIAALAWTTFAVDVGVHVDTALLSYLGLSQLPTVVGAVLLVLLTGWLLTSPGDPE